MHFRLWSINTQPTHSMMWQYAQVKDKRWRRGRGRRETEGQGETEQKKNMSSETDIWNELHAWTEHVYVCICIYTVYVYMFMFVYRVSFLAFDEIFLEVWRHRDKQQHPLWFLVPSCKPEFSLLLWRHILVYLKYDALDDWFLVPTGSSSPVLFKVQFPH